MANRVRITLTGEGESAEQALRGVENRMERVQRESRRTGQSMDRVNRVSSTMVSRLQGLAGAAGLVAGAAGLGYMINSSLSAQEELFNLHKTTGIAIERIQEYQFAARKSGIEQAQFNDAISEMSQRMGEAVADFERMGRVTEMGEGFQAAGIGMLELKRLNPTQVFDRMSTAIQQAEDEQTALNIAVKTFGDENGRRMVAMLREGEKSIGEYIQQARDLGIVLDEDVVRKGAEAKKSITTLSAALESQLSRVVGELAPEISKVADYTGDWVENNKDFLAQDIPEHIDAIYGALGDVKDIYESVPQGIVSAAGAGLVGRILFGGWNPAKFGSAVVLINEQLKALENNLNIDTPTLGQVNENAQSLYKNLQNIWDVMRGRRDWQTGELLGQTEDFEQYQQWIAWQANHLPKIFEAKENDAEATRDQGKAAEESSESISKLSKAEVDHATNIEALAARYRELYLWMEDMTKLDLQRSQALRPPSVVGPGGAGADDEWAKQAARQREATEAMAAGRGIGAATFGVDDEWAREQLDTMGEFEKAWQGMLDNTWSATQNWQDLVTDGFSYAMNSMSRTLTEFIMTGEMQWKDFARSTIEYIMQMWIKWEMWQAAKAASSSVGLAGGAAKGAAFDNGQVMQYAQGGVVNQPTIFPMANGAGVMGEDGPEAVMPLERTKGGDLGIKVAKQGRGEKKVEQHFHVNVQTGPDGKIAQESMQQMQRRLARTMKRDAQRD